MGDAVFFDTNVLIYARTAQDPLKQRTARLWMAHAAEAKAIRINRQVLNELTWWILRKEPRRSAGEIRFEIDALAFWGSTSISEVEVEAAWSIRTSHGFQWYDCLLLAAAQRADCRFFLTEDMTDGMRLGDLTIINPFAHHPDELLRPD